MDKGTAPWPSAAAGTDARGATGGHEAAAPAAATGADTGAAAALRAEATTGTPMPAAVPELAVPFEVVLPAAAGAKAQHPQTQQRAADHLRAPGLDEAISLSSR